MPSENVYLIVYPNREISHTSEGITFVCDDLLWIIIPLQTSLQELKNLILMNTGMVGKKKITKIAYRMPIAVAKSFAYQKMQIKSDQHILMMFSYHRSIGSIYSLELCVNVQDVCGSSSNSNNVEQVRNFGSEDFMPFQKIRRARSPTFNAFVTPERNIENRHARPSPSNCVASPEGITDGLVATSDEDDIQDDSGEEAEVVPEIQPLYRKRIFQFVLNQLVWWGGAVSNSTPCHYLSLNHVVMNSTTAEDRPSNYALSGEMELEIGLKFLNRETAMLAIKNYNICRSAKYKVVESDQTRYVCRSMSQDYAQLDSNVIC
ncbi:hypothetical protein Ahy_B08g091083 isoform A [Arachis hypogaea]|uniref:Transposase MuDR plant domain-containing protein n=1 Tax=Arachis hypogaea TaxID=3818 RepID=A0A444Y1E8_ARAHY|nr:hypothetical protein Ahy_B08g091083 isoform A [Arachis hypogaea]